jgi:hypothetical protein
MPRIAYQLTEETFCTLCGPDGRAREEVTLDPGAIFYRKDSPDPDNSGFNRPRGKLWRDEIGALWVLPPGTKLERAPQFDVAGPLEQARAAGASHAE